MLVREVALEGAELGEAHEELEQNCPIPCRVSPACRPACQVVVPLL